MPVAAQPSGDLSVPQVAPNCPDKSPSAQPTSATVDDLQGPRYSTGFVSCFFEPATGNLPSEDECYRVRNMFREFLDNFHGSVHAIPDEPKSPVMHDWKAGIYANLGTLGILRERRSSDVQGWIIDRIKEDFARANAPPLGPELLYVVYFSCHGNIDSEGNFTLIRGLVKFSAIRESLSCESCDILFLLDTCYSEAADYAGNVEILAAAGKHQLAPGDGFTRALIREMCTLARKGRPFSTEQLHAELVRAQYGADPSHRSGRDSPIIFYPKGAIVS